MFVRLADESVCIGPPQVKNSYLNIPSIISAATIANADAIHPGIGMLSEGKFCEDCNRWVLVIGPKYEHIEKMANKIEAKSIAKKIGLPIFTGSRDNVLDYFEAKSIAENIGYPVIIKSTNGGGGRGIKSSFKRKRSEK